MPRLHVLLMAVQSRQPAREVEWPGSSPDSDPGQIRRLKGRDPQAWEAFFSAEMPVIYRYMLSRLGEPSEAEDAASEVFEEAWDHAPKLEDHGLPARAWLFGIARHVVGTRRRRFLRRPSMLALDALDGSTGDPALSPELLDLARAIATLDSNHAEVITLRFVHGLSLQETASTLETSIDAVKGRQARALVELRRQLHDR
jgi:RNA polymerase sigma-70 factor (ECF subfamily)